MESREHGISASSIQYYLYLLSMVDCHSVWTSISVWFFSLATLFPRSWPVLPRLVRGLSLALLTLSLNIPRMRKHKPRRKQNHDPYYVEVALSSKQDQLPTPSIYRRVLLETDCDKLWSLIPERNCTSRTGVKGFGGTLLNYVFLVKVHWNSVRKGATGVFKNCPNRICKTSMCPLIVGISSGCGLIRCLTFNARSQRHWTTRLELRWSVYQDLYTVCN